MARLSVNAVSCTCAFLAMMSENICCAKGHLVITATAQLSKLCAHLFVIPQGLPALHMACLYGQLATVQLLLESRLEWIDSSDGQGRRPVHMVLSSMSSPNASSCLRYLLERGADVNV